MVLAGVAAAGALGAPARFLLDRFVAERSGGPVPWGTFTVNVVGSLVLGLLTGLALHQHLSRAAETVLGTGLCGAFTTFSTFSYETVRLIEDGSFLEASINVGASVACGLLAAGAGLAVAGLP